MAILNICRMAGCLEQKNETGLSVLIYAFIIFRKAYVIEEKTAFPTYGLRK